MVANELVPLTVKRVRYAFLALGLATLIISFTPAARVLVLIVPAASILLSLYLQERLPRYYVSFVCWNFFLIALVRRLIEYKAGASTATAVMASPFLTCFAGLAAYRHRWSRLADSRLRPWIYALSAILYAIIVGYELNSRFGMLQDAMGWLAPMAFAFYFFARRDQAPELVRAIQTSFLYGVGLMSLYGLYQYFFLAPWDAAWMVNTPNLNSIGNPLPQEVRVFSTMNSPQPLSACLVVGILICLASKNRLRFLLVPLAVLTLGLTESRSGYLGVLVGVSFLAFSFPSRRRIQLAVLVLGSATILLLAAHLSPPIQSLLTRRFETFNDLQEDGSYTDRMASQQVAINLFESSPFGLGMGASAPGEGGDGPSFGVAQPDAPTLVDNGLEQVTLTFGWFGSVVFLFGFIGAVALCFGGLDTPELVPMKASLVALLFELPVMGIFPGVDGFLLWTSLGLCAAHRWSIARS